MGNFTDEFRKLAKLYADRKIKYPHLKSITLAQWALESGRGQSQLATDYLNFGGLKWRKEMDGYATKVWYEAHDGGEYYCRFANLEAFITGYWKFIERPPYKRWEAHTATEEDYIEFISPIYCPGSDYAEKVLNLLPEARKLLDGCVPSVPPGTDPAPGTSEPVRKPGIKQIIETPNYSSRNGTPIRRIILHYTTSANVQGTIAWFKNPDAQVSAHYIVDKNGDIYQMVRDSDKAWHAKNENADSIGIEHVARQNERLTPEQEKATVQLICWLMTEYKIPKEQVTGHRFTPNNRNRTDCPNCLFGEQTEAALRAWVERNCC